MTESNGNVERSSGIPNDRLQSNPELLTEDEAINYLRLDLTGVRDPARTLRYYREKGLLKATRVGRCIRYRLEDLREFLKSQAERN